MINLTFLFAAVAIMLIVIISDLIRRKFGFDLNNINTSAIKARLANKKNAIKKSTGNLSLVLIDAGENDATVLATLRQITGMDYDTAKKLIDSAPSVILSDISGEEAALNKQALEFVGAKLEIK